MSSSKTVAYYPLSRPLALRFIGALLVVEAMALVVVSVLLAVGGGSGEVLAWVAFGELIVLAAVAHVLLQRAYVVRTDSEGYRVRLVRGAGVKRAIWARVEDVAATYVHDIPCLVIHLEGGATTTIPMPLVAVDREQFVRDVIRHLDERPGAPAKGTPRADSSAPDAAV